MSTLDLGAVKQSAPAEAKIALFRSLFRGADRSAALSNCGLLFNSAFSIGSVPRGRKQFTVTVGTIFEDSHIPISNWLLAIHLLASSKKGMSAHQLHRNLGISYKGAWFMAMRLRHAAAEGPFAGLLQGVVEVDETYIGGKAKNAKGGPVGRKAAWDAKTPVVALVERGTGKVRAFPMVRVTAENLGKAIERNVKQSAHLMTDEHPAYKSVSEDAGMRHDSVTHSKDEYVRGNIHTNTVEGFFSLLKRGVNGTFHHVSREHLFRYCDEFAFSATRTGRPRTVNARRCSLRRPKASGSPTNSQRESARRFKELWNEHHPKQRKFW